MDGSGVMVGSDVDVGSEDIDTDDTDASPVGTGVNVGSEDIDTDDTDASSVPTDVGSIVDEAPVIGSIVVVGSNDNDPDPDIVEVGVFVGGAVPDNVAVGSAVAVGILVLVGMNVAVGNSVGNTVVVG